MGVGRNVALSNVDQCVLHGGLNRVTCFMGLLQLVLKVGGGHRSGWLGLDRCAWRILKGLNVNSGASLRKAAEGTALLEA